MTSGSLRHPASAIKDVWRCTVAILGQKALSGSFDSIEIPPRNPVYK